VDESVIAQRLAELDPKVREHISEYPHASYPAELYPMLQGLTERVPVDPSEASGAGEERFQLNRDVQEYLQRQRAG